jgi:hypothetical protein
MRTPRIPSQAPRIGPPAALALLIALLVALCLGGDEARARDDRPSLEFRPIGDASKLRVDAARTRELLRFGDQIKFDNFLAEANEAGIIRFVEETLGAHAGGVPLHRVTRVAAPAGYAKSALFRYIKRRFDPDDRLIYRIALDQLRDTVGVHSIMLDELTNDAGIARPAFAQLPAFDYDDHASPGIGFLLSKFVPGYSGEDRPIVIIDSIDEIHPVSGMSLLKRVDDYVDQRKRNDPRGVAQVIVVGRPEGFVDYYRITQGGIPKEPPMILELPAFQTTGDLEAATRSVVEFAIFGEDSGRTLDGAAIRRRGEEIDGCVSKAMSLMRAHHFLRESPYNLATLDELVKVSTDYERLRLTETEFKELFFQFLLGRNRASHHRPTLQSPAYMMLLENIAHKYARDASSDRNGFFFVTPSDVVEIHDDRGTSAYLVEAVLSRSGVAYLSPVNLYVAKYRFYPSWLHGHLLDRWDARQARESGGSRAAR